MMRDKMRDKMVEEKITYKMGYGNMQPKIEVRTN